jgi:hypothetical protein
MKYVTWTDERRAAVETMAPAAIDRLRQTLVHDRRWPDGT